METGEPYAYTGDDPLNAVDPMGQSKLPPGWWVKGSKVVPEGTEGARLLPSTGERYYIPPKGSHGEPKFVNNQTGRGFEDSEGVVWTAPKGQLVGPPHWDATNPSGGHTNVAQNGDVLHGGDNFPNNVSLGKPFDPGSSSSGGGTGDPDGGGDGFGDPAGMIGMGFSVCGPGGLASNQPSICNNFDGMGPPNAKGGGWNG
jgi:hypothetical protein